MTTPTTFRRARRYFVWVLAVSLLAFVVAMSGGGRPATVVVADDARVTGPPVVAQSPALPSVQGGATQPQDRPAHPQDRPALPPDTTAARAAPSVDLSPTIAVVSLLTSLVSAVGIGCTTVLGWRKERRESALADVALQKATLELEQLRQAARARDAGH